MKQTVTLVFLAFSHLIAHSQQALFPPGFPLFSSNPVLAMPADTLTSDPEMAGTASLGSPSLAPCDNYQLLECGQTYYNHNNFGYGNELTTYCVTGAFNGPDRVYRVDIPDDRPVKFVLDILDNVDLDILILSNCQTLVCAGWSIQDNPGLGVYREIVDVHLTAGAYYVVIDGQYSTSYGDYNLTMDCSCSPLEDKLDPFPVFANINYCENFESFLPGGPVADVSSRWGEWPASNFTDGVIATDADGNQMARLVNNNATESPYIIHILDNQTS
ncbi:MAG: hypothetical protein L6Q97_07290, partial [Thermoanaerobaculia bacterium]|nr:hypothetical protein [Thermoanaerobaculia bacterium]